jgi:hypothetical protein
MQSGNSMGWRVDAAGQLNSMLGGPSCGLKDARQAAAKLEFHLQAAGPVPEESRPFGVAQDSRKPSAEQG